MKLIAMTKAEKHPIAHLVGDIVCFVVVPLLDRLRLFEAIADISEELLALLHSLGDGCYPCVTRFVGTDRQRVTPVDDPEWGVPQQGWYTVLKTYSAHGSHYSHYRG